MNAKFKEIGILNSYSQIYKELPASNKDVIFSVSGYSDVLVLAHSNVLKIFQLKSEFNSKSSEYSLNFNAAITSIRNPITKVLVIPIISLKKSSNGMPDWTCICIGFNNGEIKFYDEWGQMILCQSFNGGSIEENASIDTVNPIIDLILWNNIIKTYGDISIAPNQVDKTEFLYILYGSYCIEIVGRQLYDLLCCMKRRLARQQAGFIETNSSTLNGANIDEVLNYRKLFFTSQDVMHDSHKVNSLILGNVNNDTLVDNIFYYSTTKNPFIDPSESSTNYIPCAIVGKYPFINFYRLPFESDAMDMNDIAHAVYTKVKGAIFNSVSSWFGGSSGDSQSSKSPTNVDKSPKHIISKFKSLYTISEEQRCVTQIVTTPAHINHSRMSASAVLALAAVADDHGRVFLLDMKHMSVLRVWKGYRDVQLSISTVTETHRSSSSKQSFDRYSASVSVNYLVIYAPRRSLIEIWPLPFGDRVVSFDLTGKCAGKLIHVPHIGLGVSQGLVKNLPIRSTHSTYYLENGTGMLHSIEVPFHLSMTATSSNRSQDNLVIKQFKKFLKSQEHHENINELSSEFTTALNLLKLCPSVDYLMNIVSTEPHVDPSLFIEFINKLINGLNSETIAQSSTENERNNLYKSWINKQFLLQFYIDISSCFSSISHSNEEMDIDQKEETTYYDIFNNQLDKIANLYIKYHPRSNKSSLINSQEKQCNLEYVPISFTQFFNCFQYDQIISDQNNTQQIIQLTKTGVTENDLKRIGQLFFGDIVNKEEASMEIFKKDVLSKYNMDSEDIMKLFLIYLTNQPNELSWIKRMKIYEIMCTIINEYITLSDYNMIMKLCKLCFETIEKSKNLLVGLIISSIIRKILFDEFEREKDRNGDKSIIGQFEENVSLWSDHCLRFQDLCLFSSLMKCCPLFDELSTNKKRKLKKYRSINTQSKSSYSDQSCVTSGEITFTSNCDNDFTMATALDIGKGLFSDRISKWLVKWDFTLCNIKELYKSLGKVVDEAEQESVLEHDDYNSGGGNDNDVSGRTSHCSSLSSTETYQKSQHDTINKDTKEIFALLYKQLPHSLEFESVLITLSWEYARIWSMSLQRVEYLERSVELLESIGPLGGIVVQGISGLMWETLLLPALHVLFPIRDPSSRSSRASPASFFTTNSNADLAALDTTQAYSENLRFDVLQKITRLLQLIINANESVDVVPTFSSDRVWNLHQNTDESNDLSYSGGGTNSRRVKSLIEMVIAMVTVASTPDMMTQSSLSHNAMIPDCTIQIDCVQLHLELFIVLQLISMTIGTHDLISGQFRYYTLFSHDIRNILFGPLTKRLAYDLIETNIEDGCTIRIQFLERIIIYFVLNRDDQQSNKDFITEFEELKERVKELNEYWKLNYVEGFNKCYIECLFGAGYDTLALQLFQNLTIPRDRNNMAHKLLKIIGCRFMKLKNDSTFIIPMSQGFKNWLVDLNKESSELRFSKKEAVNLSNTIDLIGRVIDLIPDNHPNMELATEMSSLLTMIQTRYK